jgi:2-keto-3-deoxy-L-rhamnonate aldolase RhmA
VSLQRKIVNAVMAELNGRKGYDNLWDDLSHADQRDLKSALRVTVEEVLTAEKAKRTARVEA